MDSRIRFLGSALDDLRAFPEDARKDTGYALHVLETGDWPPNTKSMSTVGQGVHEIRVSDDGRAFRTFFVAKFDGLVYVLHSFEKKSAETPLSEIKLGRARYRELVRARKLVHVAR